MERVGGQAGRCVRGMRMCVMGWHGGVAWHGLGWERDVGGPGGWGTSVRGMMQQVVGINVSVGHGVTTRSTPVPTPSLHPLGPGPIPDVSSRTRSASHHVT